MSGSPVLALALVTVAAALVRLVRRFRAGLAASQLRRRLREISRVLARHGLGWVLGPAWLGRLLPGRCTATTSTAPSRGW